MTQCSNPQEDTPFQVQAGKCYLTRAGQTVRLRENKEGWLDKLPFIAEPVFGPVYPMFTVNEKGWVWPQYEPDLFGVRHNNYSDLIAEVEIKEQ